ncbi:hypothetical protein [Lyngbya sp. CCY1209]|uniref:hypothetical protein n=1 Tax=Lyngbya sp. CCY1209 TaxID=2886103 RepID=UPI002D20CAA4|nr:hypothetical protein [Lyngbya sp. CCY1209]MEB3882564.1 hypothetical protein [Lyngbya sp. CCY1209]
MTSTHFSQLNSKTQGASTNRLIEERVTMTLQFPASAKPTPVRWLEPSLSEQLNQLYSEIQTLTATVKQLEHRTVFRPPSRDLPLAERLEMHYQSLRSEKERGKQLKKTRNLLLSKRQEFDRQSAELGDRKAEIENALDRLGSQMWAVKRAERAYCEALEALDAIAETTGELLNRTYGGDTAAEFERLVESQHTPDRCSLLPAGPLVREDGDPIRQFLA